MATDPTITSPLADEDAFAYPRFTHTSVSLRFSQLLQTLLPAIEAERDIERGCAQHHLFDASFTAAEHGWGRVVELAGEIVAEAAERRSDQVLRRTAMLFHEILGCETREEFTNYETLLVSRPELFASTASGALGWRINGMLDSAKRCFAAIADLDMIKLLETDEERLSVSGGMTLRP